ncbi:unnamed protein product [Rotaria sp. Silwood1]|nr:unnamed protein product [Rotaria sp. Silwood1]
MMDNYQQSILSDYKSNRNSTEQNETIFTMISSTTTDGKTFDLCEQENILTDQLEKCKVKDATHLPERIKRTYQRIDSYICEDRIEEAEQERKYLDELEQTQILHEQVVFQKSNRYQKNTLVENSRSDLKNLRDDLIDMPCCAEKMTMELLVYFHQRLVDDFIFLETSDSVIQKLGELKTQIQNEELFSEEIRTYFDDLNRNIYNEDCSSAVNMLNNILRKIRPLHLQEIQRLIEKMEKTAELIRNKDIVLLIGVTGCGKSTTVQFLAGAKMKETKVAIVPGKFLDHIEMCEPIKNPGLIHITTSPYCRSETRYVVPVTVSLQDIFGLDDTGEIIFCDTPGFDDTSGPEVDIANSAGVLEVLKNCKSVKILALLSYKSSGDKGQGIQKLTQILVKMIDHIEDRLRSIMYAFTNYKPTTDIHAILHDLKDSKVNNDLVLRSDKSFVALLTDMINKTEYGAEIINPIDGDPKNLIEKVRSLDGIENPAEVFQFSCSESTQSTISNQIYRYKTNITYALKHKNLDLLLYNLRNFNILKNLLKQNFIEDSYNDSIRSVNEKINEYSEEIIKDFNRCLISHDGFKEEDILKYKYFHNYIQQIQKLKDYLGSNLISDNIFIEYIISQLEKNNFIRTEQDLYNPFIRIYLNNIQMLQNSFKELQSYYTKICEKLDECFLKFLEPISEIILNNKFEEIAKIIGMISKYSSIFNDHLNGKVEEKYKNIIEYLFEHLNSFSIKIDPFLSKIRLEDSDIKIIENYINILRSAKETSILEDQILKYVEKMKNQNKISNNLNKIYDDFISKILKHFNEIHRRIEELFRKNGDYALEYIEELFIQLNLIHELPEIKTVTARIYYHNIENIRGYMQKRQKDTEQLLLTFDHQSGIMICRHLARSLARLTSLKWFDRFSPGTYQLMMCNINKELEEHVKQLENRLKKINFTLKCPENIHLAHDLIDKIELMSILESYIPQIKSFRDQINEYFIKIIQNAFDNIKKTFNLSEKTIKHLKEKLNQLEEIKNQCDYLNPALDYLKKSGYQDFKILNDQIENLKIKQSQDLEPFEAKKSQIEIQLDDINSIMQNYSMLISSKKSEGVLIRMISKVAITFEKPDRNPDSYLKEKGYSNIEAVKETFENLQIIYFDILQSIDNKKNEFKNSLDPLISIKEKYISLSSSSEMISSKQNVFLEEKEYTSYESLEQDILRKKIIIEEYEKNNAIYYFSDKLDASVANNALIYVSNCEKLENFQLNKMVDDMNSLLQKYIKEYGNFLYKEIDRNFKHITNVNETDIRQYSKDFDNYFQELNSLNKYANLFQCISGDEKLENYYRQFLNYHRFLDNQMEYFSMSSKYKELKHLLVIAQSLTCLDRFSSFSLSDYGFRGLYKQYHLEIFRISQDAHKLIIDYISKGDYAYVDLALADIDENLSNSKYLNQIKHDLECSLNKLMKHTKSMAYWIEGNISKEKNNIRLINDNIENISIILTKNRIMNLIDEKTRDNLRKFPNEIHQILTKIFIHEVHSIDLFIHVNYYLEAEQSIENLTHALRELSDNYKSNVVYEKKEQLQKRLNHLLDDILQRYDFSDVEKYHVHPPKDIFEQLKRVLLSGNPKYVDIYKSLLEKIRVYFSLNLDKLGNDSSKDHVQKILLLKNAFCFLPEELKILFQFHIDQLK